MRIYLPAIALLAASLLAADNTRPFLNDADARFWLENMAVYHRFTLDEMSAACGMDTNRVATELARLKIKPEAPPAAPRDRLLVLPYPGGRHPRIGFLEGAIDPQRETKVSIFLPWDPSSYVVADVPEAIWSNLGLTYLAHTHVPTIWTKEKIDLPRLEWKRSATGELRFDRTLPNGIAFGAEIHPRRNGVRMREWLHNGADKPLTDLRVQNCVMLKNARGFTALTNANKVFKAPYCAVKSDAGDRWIITAWSPIHRTWGNPPVPCLHADPKFPDCEPGQTVEVRGWLSFFEGNDLDAEFKRLDQLKWQAQEDGEARAGSSASR